MENRKKTGALFPGYLFFLVESDWKRIFTKDLLFAVRGVLMRDTELLLLEQRVIDEIRAREDSDGVVHFGPIGAGTKIRVKEGQMFGMLGVIDCYRSENRVRVLLDVLGRVTPVELPDSVVELEVAEIKLSRSKRKKLLSKQRRKAKRARDLERSVRRDRSLGQRSS